MSELREAVGKAVHEWAAQFTGKVPNGCTYANLIDRIVAALAPSPSVAQACVKCPHRGEVSAEGFCQHPATICGCKCEFAAVAQRPENLVDEIIIIAGNCYETRTKCVCESVFCEHWEEVVRERLTALLAPPPTTRENCRGNETGFHTCGLPIGGCGVNTPPAVAQGCIKCGHNDGVDREGICKHRRTKVHGECGCKCEFAAVAQRPEAGDCVGRFYEDGDSAKCTKCFLRHDQHWDAQRPADLSAVTPEQDQGEGCKDLPHSTVVIPKDNLSDAVPSCQWTWSSRKEFWATECGGGLDLRGGFNALKYSAIIYCPFCRKLVSDPFLSGPSTQATGGPQTQHVPDKSSVPHEPEYLVESDGQGNVVPVRARAADPPTEQDQGE